MRHCLDCPAVLTSKSPRCPEHRAVQRLLVDRERVSRWRAVPENRERERAAMEIPRNERIRRARMARMHALADQLGYILVPIP